MSQPNAKRGVLLLAHGSPDSPEEVPEFLRYVTGGRQLPPAVVQEIQHRYALIGHSPLTEITRKQAECAARLLQLPVYVGMRNWQPFIADAVREMAADGIEQAAVICMAPHNSRTSVGLYRSALESAGPKFQYEFVENWHDHPLLIQAFAERCEQGWRKASAEAGTKLPVIFTAHSVPQRTIDSGDPYAEQARETAGLVAMEVPSLDEDRYTFAFQSQGMSGGPWLGPTVEATIDGLKAQGHRGVFIQPIGFVCDHVEVLYDIDIAFRKFAEERGMQLWRAESLNDSSTFCAAIAEVARAALRESDGQPKPQIVQVNASNKH
jgi:protoporphyrin/coproporphyrin ferrochelatase